MTVVNNNNNTMDNEEDWTTGLSSVEVCEIEHELRMIEIDLEVEQEVASMNKPTLEKEWDKVKKVCELVDLEGFIHGIWGDPEAQEVFNNGGSMWV